MEEEWKQYKDQVIDYLLNNFMKDVMSIPIPANIGVRFAISACLRFACAAAQKLKIDFKEIADELELEWHAEIYNFGSNSGDVVN